MALFAQQIILISIKVSKLQFVLLANLSTIHEKIGEVGVIVSKDSSRGHTRRK